MSSSIVEKDIANAKELSAKIEEIVDRRIAHLDLRGSDAKVTFDEVRTSVDYFDGLAYKYILFFTGMEYAEKTLKPRLAFNATKIFEHPFVKPTPTV